MLAGLGYVALTADIYGKGVRPKNAQEAQAEAGKYYKDRTLWRARAKAGLDFLASRPEADPDRLAVMGYCFGGGTALELARSGAPVKGVVTFHGSLSSATPEEAKNIKGKCSSCTAQMIRTSSRRTLPRSWMRCAKEGLTGSSCNTAARCTPSRSKGQEPITAREPLTMRKRTGVRGRP